MTDGERPAPTQAGLGTIALPTFAVMALVAAVMSFVLLHQVGNYERLLMDAKQSTGIPGPLILALSRALDAAVMKTCSVFVAFLLVFLGGLYTLRVTDSAYRLSVETGQTKGMLETASPGLVMLTLGAALSCVTVMKESSISLETGQGPPSQGQPDSVMVRSGAVTAGTAGSQSVGVLTDDDLRTLNTAFMLIAPDAHWTQSADKELAQATRARLDGLRRTVALARYPTIGDRFAEIAEMKRSRPQAFSALDMHEREAFLAVERLLGLTLSASGR